MMGSRQIVGDSQEEALTNHEWKLYWFIHHRWLHNPKGPFDFVEIRKADMKKHLHTSDARVLDALDGLTDKGYISTTPGRPAKNRPLGYWIEKDLG